MGLNFETTNMFSIFFLKNFLMTASVRFVHKQKSIDNLAIINALCDVGMTGLEPPDAYSNQLSYIPKCERKGNANFLFCKRFVRKNLHSLFLY